MVVCVGLRVSGCMDELIYACVAFLVAIARPGMYACVCMYVRVCVCVFMCV